MKRSSYLTCMYHESRYVITHAFSHNNGKTAKPQNLADFSRLSFFFSCVYINVRRRLLSVKETHSLIKDIIYTIFVLEYTSTGILYKISKTLKRVLKVLYLFVCLNTLIVTETNYILKFCTYNTLQSYLCALFFFIE